MDDLDQALLMLSLRLALVLVAVVALGVAAGGAILYYWLRLDRAIELLESIDESLRQLPAVRQTRSQRPLRHTAP
jgi:hypothetical protein